MKEGIVEQETAALGPTLRFSTDNKLTGGGHFQAQVAAQSDVCWTVMLGDQSPGGEHREAGISKHVVGDEGAQLAQHSPCLGAPPHIQDQRSALVHQVICPPLTPGSVIDLPAWRQRGAAAGGRLVVNALKLSQESREALLQELHVMSLHFSGEEGRRGQVGEEEHLWSLDCWSTVEVPALVPHPFVHTAHTGPGVAFGVVLQTVVQPLVQAFPSTGTAETLRRLTKGKAVLLFQQRVLPFAPEAAHHTPDVAGPTKISATQGAGAVLSAHSVTVPHKEQQHTHASGKSTDLTFPYRLHPSSNHLPHILQ